MHKKREKVHIVIQAMKKDMQTLPMACRKAEIGLSTWYYWEDRIPKLKKVRKMAERLCGDYRNAAMEDANFKLGIGGNVAAQCFYLKNKAGWKDSPLIDQSKHSHFIIHRPAKKEENGNNAQALPRRISIQREAV